MPRHRIGVVGSSEDPTRTEGRRSTPGAVAKHAAGLRPRVRAVAQHDLAVDDEMPDALRELVWPVEISAVGDRGGIEDDEIRFLPDDDRSAIRQSQARGR